MYRNTIFDGADIFGAHIACTYLLAVTNCTKEVIVCNCLLQYKKIHNFLTVFSEFSRVWVKRYESQWIRVFYSAIFYIDFIKSSVSWLAM
jgi:hypothetical protein